MEDKTVEMWIKKKEETKEETKEEKKSEVFTVGFGDEKIEATYTYEDIFDWVNEIKKCLRARPNCDLIAGICAFSGESFSEKRYNPYCISIISICVFGSHCLVVPIGRRPFPSSLRSFLTGGNVRLVGLDVEKLVEKMNREWQVAVKTPVELRQVVEQAFGKQAVARSGKRDGGLEELAKAALGGIIVKKKDKNVQYNPWDRTPGNVEAEVLRATVDAFLACKIGMKSFQMISRRRHR